MEDCFSLEPRKTHARGQGKQTDRVQDGPTSLHLCRLCYSCPRKVAMPGNGRSLTVAIPSPSLSFGLLSFFPSASSSPADQAYQKTSQPLMTTSNTPLPDTSTNLLLLTHNFPPSQRSPTPQALLRLLEALALLLLFPIDPDRSSRKADRNGEDGIQSSVRRICIRGSAASFATFQGGRGAYFEMRKG